MKSPWIWSNKIQMRGSAEMNHKIAKYAAVALLLTSMLVLTACPKKGTATVSCGHIDKLQSGLGMLNLPQMKLGNVVQVSGTTVAFKDAMDMTSGDVSLTPGDTATEIANSTALDITFSANIPGTADAGLKTALTNNMQLKLTNSQRHQIDHPETVVNRDSNKARLLGFFEHAGAGDKFLLIHAGNSAESVKFELKNGAANELHANIPGVGDFKLTIDYECQGSLSKAISAANSNNMVAFFKVVELKKNSDGSISTAPFAIPNDYDWTSARPPGAVK
jgi:hypothetical protein